VQLYAEYAYPLVAALAMFGSLRYATSVAGLPPLVELVALVPAGAAVYLIVAYLLERRFDWGLERNLRVIRDGLDG
jgi:PST family polysaccharide transporter/lipopolysaccharide exporter